MTRHYSPGPILDRIMERSALGMGVTLTAREVVALADMVDKSNLRDDESRERLSYAKWYTGYGIALSVVSLVALIASRSQ